jgi:hypothetical protein
MPTVKQLKKGDFFSTTATHKQVLIRGDYIRATKRFACYRANDINHTLYLKGDKVIYTNFEY